MDFKPENGRGPFSVRRIIPVVVEETERQRFEAGRAPITELTSIRGGKNVEVRIMKSS